jgi:hypothetical protein
MIEMRIVEISDGCRSEIQYRHYILIADAYSGAVYEKGEIWSEWKTAPYVDLMYTQND